MSHPADFELVLFEKGEAAVAVARRAGIGSMMVDLEWRGKEERQRSADTEINRDRPEDLATLRRLGVPARYCRLNRFGPWTAEEIEATIWHGANHLLLPMVRSAREVETVLEWIGGRCSLGVLVETREAVELSPQLAALPFDRVYVGLNDLAICRGSNSIFDALTDGTVEALRRHFTGREFGFGGVTVTDGGHPVPGYLLLAEMARLGCSFSFLRRSFKRDVRARDMSLEVTRIHAMWRRLTTRTAEEMARHRQQLCAVLATGATSRHSTAGSA